MLKGLITLPTDFIDTTKKFYAAFPQGIVNHKDVLVDNDKDRLLERVKQSIQQAEYSRYFIMESVAIVEEEQKPITVKEY